MAESSPPPLASALSFLHIPFFLRVYSLSTAPPPRPIDLRTLLSLPRFSFVKAAAKTRQGPDGCLAKIGRFHGPRIAADYVI